MSTTEEDSCSKVLEFRGREYEIEFQIKQDRLLVICIEDIITTEQWIGKYDSSYIEELSHKTGNFKQFPIFCSMLESAISKNSEAVSLDLLTYDDLNILRQQQQQQQHATNKRKSSELQQKRYLIMTYTVEFDQIHYPLPLTYHNRRCADTKVKNKSPKTALRHEKNARLRYEELLDENIELKEELSSCYERLKEKNVSKEVNVLRKVVKNLESELHKERSKHQRLNNKKKKEYEELLEEFEDLKANERNFKVRCKNLTEELAVLKRNSRISPLVTQRRNRSIERQQLSRRPSLENQTKALRGRSISRGRRASSGERSVSSATRRTPSPGYIRFDPSAYVRSKEKKRKEAKINISRRRTPTDRRNPSSNSNYSPAYHVTKPPAGERRGRSSSLNRNELRHVRQQSAGSDTDSIGRLRSKTINKKPLPARRKASPAQEMFRETGTRKFKVKSSSPTTNRFSRDKEDEHSIGIAEIDARLEALQRFMKENLD